MTTLRVVHDTNNSSRISTPLDTKAGGPDDQMACILKYLRSLEHAAEKVHGDDDDWRYGRYLVHRIMNAAVRQH